MSSSFTVHDVRQHNSEEDAWIVYKDDVYDITQFVSRHPGGREILHGKFGQDVTKIMADAKVHNHSDVAYNLMKKYHIGNLLYSKNHKNRDNDELKMDGYKENELVDWSKPMVAQVGKLGAEYMKWVHSPVDRPLRLFAPAIVEFFSKTPWYMVPILWLPVVLYLAIVGILNLQQDHAFLTSSFQIFIFFAAMFLIGILVWTLLEYGLHRYLFHIVPPDDSPFWITFHFFFHGQHHKVPFDTGRLVFPPVAASAFAIPFYVLLVYLLPYGIANCVFSGGMFGYVIYDCTHYYLHHGSPAVGSYFYNLRSYHVSHHFVNPHQSMYFNDLRTFCP